MGFLKVASSLVLSSTTGVGEELRANGNKAMFQWGGTIYALFMLIMNRTGRRSSVQTTLLVLYLFTSFPTVLFKILRGQFGYWIAFLTVAANLFFPEIFPVSRFVLFVITPDWVAHGLRSRIVSGVFCIIIGSFLFAAEVRGIGGFRNCECNFHRFGYCFGMVFLFFFPILYLGLSG